MSTWILSEPHYRPVSETFCRQFKMFTFNFASDFVRVLLIQVKRSGKITTSRHPPTETMQIRRRTMGGILVFGTTSSFQILANEDCLVQIFTPVLGEVVRSRIPLNYSFNCLISRLRYIVSHNYLK